MKKYLMGLLFVICTLSIYSYNQVIVSYIDGGLLESDNYELTNYSLEDQMKGFSSSGFEDILNFSYSGENNFTKVGDNYQYSSSTQEYLMVPVVKNIVSSVSKGEFILSENEALSDGDYLRKILIDENFALPAVGIDLTEESISVGNKFTYSEDGNIVKEHFTEYKNQEYLIRISRRGTSAAYDIYGKNGQLRVGDASALSFLEKTTNYLDFRFDGDDYGQIQEEKTSYGIDAKFVPGDIRIGGLPNGDYTLSLYSIRYSSTITNKGYMVISLEDEINFSADDIDTGDELIVTHLYEGAHPNIAIEGVVISTSSTPTISVREVYNSTENTISSGTITLTALDKFYVDSTQTITLGADGYNLSDGKYYKKFNIEYESTFTSKDNLSRQVYISSGATEVVEEYKVEWNSLPLITDYPYQTVIAFYTASKEFGGDPYEIIDNGMSKYTYGYRGVKYISGSNLDSIIRGSYTNTVSLSFNDDTYLWEGTSGSQQSIIINKVVSDSKGSYYRTASSPGSYLDFYTNGNLQNFTYEEEGSAEKDDNATFYWSDSEQNSNDVIISDDRLIFRISRIEEGGTGLVSKDYYVRGTKYSENLPEYYLDLYNNLNPIGTFTEKTAIENFVTGSRDYVDLIFKKGEDREVEGGDGVFTFSKENSFKITGLPRGNYMLQVYSIKNADLETQRDTSIDYKTLTFEKYKEFEMGLPTLATGDFSTRNNLFLIDSINVYSSYDDTSDIPRPIKDIQVNFITKAELLLSLSTNNLIAENTEEGGTGNSMAGESLAEWHEESGGQAVLSMDLTASEQSAFQFPLDIVFLVDNSGSMQPHIDRVKAGLTSFTQNLTSRGFDVKYNLITYGPPQTTFRRRYWFWWIEENPVGSWDSDIYFRDDYINTSSYERSYPHVAKYKEEWFDSLTETIDAFGEISSTYGYPYGQENGAWAVYYGLEHLKNNGRYLDSENNIVSHSEGQEGDIPSQKWVIFLTDENFDGDNLSSIPNIGSYSSFKDYVVKNVSDVGVSLTGIYHIGRREVDDVGEDGINPSDRGDYSYNDIRTLTGTDIFSRYELGSSGLLAEAALYDSVGSVGIIQRWLIKYESPFNLSDGFKREVVFSLTNIEDADGLDLTIAPYIVDHDVDRYYRVPSEKVEAYFRNPSSSNSDFVKENGQIRVEVLARSQYNEIDENGETQLTNYRIEKGIVSIYSESGDNSIVLSSDYNEVDIVPYGNGWYLLVAVIDAEKFESKFAGEPINIEATAATKENGKTISMQNLGITEKDNPIITEVTLTNDSLFDLLTGLKDEYGNSVYTALEATNLASISYKNNAGIELSAIQNYFDSAANRLAVKTGDTISYVVNVTDESISQVNGSFVTIGASSAGVSLIGSTYSGTAVLGGTDTSVRIRIEDDYANLSEFNNTDGSPASIEMLQYPDIYSPMTFVEGTYFGALSTGSTDENRALLTGNTEYLDALGYILVFKYDITHSDGYEYDDVNLPVNTYSHIDNGIYWAASTDNIFALIDGKYEYKQLLVISKSGKIYDVGVSLLDVLGRAYTELNEFSDPNLFYVDTVAPRIASSKYTKVEDSNGVNITGDNLEVKTGDKIDFVFGVEEKNPDRGEMTSGGSNASYISSSVDFTTNEIKERYEITYNIAEHRNPTLSFTFDIYDKAENKTEYIISIVYDSYLPGDLRIEEEILEEGIKFTSNTEYYLKTINDSTYNSVAYAEVNGRFREITSLPVSINNFNLAVIENGNNPATIVSYSKSGMKSVPYTDQIVVDTAINGGTLGEGRAVTTNGISYEVSIDFGNILELVGLYGFKVETSGVIVDGGSEDYNILSGGSYSTVPVSSNYDENYILKFDRNVPGDYTINITLKDRLGNTAVMPYKIKISNILKLRGKKEGSDVESESSVEIYEGIDIKERDK